jgi:hypothetical protein
MTAALWAWSPVGWAAAQPASGAGGTRAGAASKDPADSTKLDRLILRSGRVIEGRILEETDTSVKMLVIVGSMRTEGTYSKADVLAIERGAGGEAPKAGEARPTAAAPKTDAPKKEAAKEGASKIYIIELKGEFGRDVSATPLRRVIADARKFQPDILLVKMDTDFKIHGEEKEAFEPGGAEGAFDQQLETARQLQTLLTDNIRDDPEWTVKPRQICWVKRALGGAAFLPFVFPEIYYTSDGLHGGIGYLDFLFEGVGDDVVRQKQRSLRLGRAEGLANKGGHNPLILRAMALAEMWLTVKYVGGKPVFFERPPEGPDEELLTDDASKENDRRDTIQDAVRLKGNDNLNLTADLAYKLGVSRGTADTLEDLLYQIGVSRNYTVVDGKAADVLAEWGRQVVAAERGFRAKYREQAELQPDPPGGYAEQQRFLATRIRLLTDCRDLLERYKEAIDPRRIGGPPEQWITRLNVMIEQLKTQLRLMRRP